MRLAKKPHAFRSAATCCCTLLELALRLSVYHPILTLTRRLTPHALPWLLEPDSLPEPAAK